MSRKQRSKIDIGLIWAKYMNIWGQVGTVAGTVNLIMMLGVFYTTTLKPATGISLWLYILIMVTASIAGTLFVVKVGTSGYYRFFSQQSKVAETNERVQETDRKLRLIMDKLGIDDNGKESK